MPQNITNLVDAAKETSHYQLDVLPLKISELLKIVLIGAWEMEGGRHFFSVLHWGCHHESVFRQEIRARAVDELVMQNCSTMHSHAVKWLNMASELPSRMKHIATSAWLS